MNSRRGVIIITGCIALGTLLILWLSQDAPAPPLRAGSRGPSFVLSRLDNGLPLSFDSLEGQVVLINFWATWCKPCEEEMPSMERLYQHYAGQGFSLLAISVDTDRAEVEKFQERYGFTFPILLDPKQKVASLYQTNRFPESFLIDSQGRIAGRFIGPREWDAPAYLARVGELLSSSP